MKKDQLISMLNQYKKTHSRQYGIKRLGLFGSIAKGTSTDQSDIDIVVELERQDLFFLIGIKQDIEEQLHSKVDIVSYRDTMNPFLRQRIDQEALYA
jgi:predicted nucleotidyltransferase